MIDPILERLRQPGANSTITHEIMSLCALLETRPENVCVPGVRMLVDMAGQLMELQHGAKQ